MRFFAHVLALFSLLAISLMPSGYMVATAEDGTLSVRICSTGESNQMQVFQDDPDYQTYRLLYGDSDEAEHGPANEPCDMGPSPLGDLGRSPELTPLLVAAETEQNTNRPILSGIFPAALPPSTGPPLF